MNRFVLLAMVLMVAEGVVAAEPASQLPQKHPYQQQLRKFMGTLKAEDLAPAHKDLAVVPFDGDADEKFRMWILSLSPPAVGRKRNYSSVMVKAAYFTLEAIEGAKSIMRPPAHPEPLVDLANWNYPGNPYFNSRPLRLRAFVLAALDMIMLDQLIESGDDKDKPNPDQLAGGIGRFAYVYSGVRDVLPEEVRIAYLTGLKKLVRRALDQAPAFSGRTQGMHTWATPALAMAAKVLNDPEVSKQVEAYARPIFTDKRFFRAAGYFPNGGTLDSFNGISTYYAVWGALAGDWPFAREAIARVYRLRAHLTLPEPDGALVGPSHMASLTSAEPAHEQWNWHPRAWAAAMIADDAACLEKMPDESDIQKAAALVVAEVNTQLHELSLIPGGVELAPWKFQAVGTVVNYAYQYYPKGYYACRIALEKQQDTVRLPVLRDGNFIRTFEDEFLVAKTQTHAAIIHTGPIADASADPAYGFGGGALSAFWTRDTGAVILGRGIGAWSPQYKKSLDEWRSLPTHAVTGITADGKVFTSAHIVTPQTTIESSDKNYTVTARGVLPSFRHGADKRLAGNIDYTRKFESSATGVSITTTIKSDGKDRIAELYEVLPVFLRDAGHQPKATPTTIELQADGKWLPASEAFTDKVSAVRLSRFSSAVLITFECPCRVKLAPPWADTYMTRVACHNLLIDLLEGGNRPASINDAGKISYRIEAVAR